jgi:hypothetical protein
MNSLRIKIARSMKIQNQQMNSLIQKLGRFLHEGTQCPATRGLVTIKPPSR